MKAYKVSRLNEPHENYGWVDFVGQDVTNMGIKVQCQFNTETKTKMLGVGNAKDARVLGDYMVGVLLCDKDCTKPLVAHLVDRGDLSVN